MDTHSIVALKTFALFLSCLGLSMLILYFFHLRERSKHAAKLINERRVRDSRNRRWNQK